MSVSSLDFSSLAFPVKDKPVVLLSIHNAQERQLIQKFLPGELSIKTSAESLSVDQSFDLCILDQQSFEENKDKLQNLKEQAAPIFLPFLLLIQTQKSVQNSSEILEFADDIVYIPAPLKLLKSRIQTMLKQREYSLRLQEKNCQLEQKNKELAEEKKKYQLITENSTDMISRHTPEGIYLYASEAGRNLTGYKPEELVGQKIYDFIHPADQDRFRNKIKKFKNPVERIAYRKKTKSGFYKWVESTMRLIRDQETGKVAEIQASTRDISARKQFEQKLKQSIREKKTLMQEIHHRVKNNLAVVSGMLQLQAFDSENREVKKFLSDSENRIKTMALIHEQLYKSSSLSKIDFGLYVRQLIGNIREVSEKKNMNIELEHDSFNLNVNQAVPCALILNEVISNSYRFIEDEKEKFVQVHLKEKNGRIFVQISNDFPDLSKKFLQKEKSSVGLTIIKTLIKQLESELHIASENGHLVLSFSFAKQEIKGSTSGII